MNIAIFLQSGFKNCLRFITLRITNFYEFTNIGLRAVAEGDIPVVEASLHYGLRFAAEPQKNFEFPFKIIEARREIATAGNKLCFSSKADRVSPEAICPKTHLKNWLAKRSIFFFLPSDSEGGRRRFIFFDPQ